MNQILKTKIDGVPVEIEIVRMGPATGPELKKLEKNLIKEDKTFAISPPQQIRVLKVGDDQTPATAENVAKVKNALASTKDPALMIQDLAASIQSVPVGKDWWTSKTVWINGIAIITAVLAYFNLDVNIDPELFATIFPVILAVINLWLRKGTEKPLTANIVPKLPTKIKIK